MKSRAIHWFLIVAFSVALGHLTWQAVLGPPPAPDYMVGGEGPALTVAHPDEKHLYLRRTLYLSQQPRCAWLEALSRDRLELFVNGRQVEKRALDGLDAAIIVDLAPYLHVGPNVIAIHANQSSIGRPPVVAVEGAYTLDDGEHAIPTDHLWRSQTFYERKSTWWFMPEFDDRSWPFAPSTTCYLRAKASGPPGAARVPCTAHWISPQRDEHGCACLTRDFALTGRPRQGWLRLTTDSSYRLAVNGILLDQQEDQLGVRVSNPPILRVYDITTVLRPGTNTLALVLTSIAGSPHVLADAEVDDGSGALFRLESDKGWLSQAGIPENWQDVMPSDTQGWEPCYVESGDLQLPPWSMTRQAVTISLPWSTVLKRAAEELGLMVLIGIMVRYSCVWLANRFTPRDENADRPCLVGPFTLALVPVTVAIAAGVLATFDPRVPCQDIYAAHWVWLAIASVLLQWLAFPFLDRGKRLAWKTFKRIREFSLPISLHTGMVIGLLVLGFWLRIRDIDAEPLQWDEVENYNATQGFLKHGFPSLEVHKDLPRLAIHTSELEFVFHGMVALIYHDPVYIVRFPCVCFSTLTIGLIYLVGRRLFDKSVGLIAAIIFTLAPTCITMSTFGRYFAQLQFFTLLTIYAYWLTLRGCGPINRRALVLTVVSFIAMFLSWEASALLAPGMVLAALIQRRGRLHSILRNSSVWAMFILIAMIVVLQRSLAMMAQAKFIWYGISLSDVKLLPMWGHQAFEPWYYIWESSWTQDTFLPMLGFLGAIILAIKHPWRRPIRFLLLIHISTCLLMCFTLPNCEFRYILQLIPFPILLASAALVASAGWVFTLVQQESIRSWRRVYGYGINVVVVTTLIALGCGMTIQLRAMENFRVDGFCPYRCFKYPNLGAASKYVREHFHEGDLVLSPGPYQTSFLMGYVGQPVKDTFYMLQTDTRFLPATLTDRENTLRDRRDGSKMIATPEALEDLFARNDRIWYITDPGQHYALIAPPSSSFLGQHMDVVYEDWDSVVFFSGDAHRTIDRRLKDEQDQSQADATIVH